MGFFYYSTHTLYLSCHLSDDSFGVDFIAEQAIIMLLDRTSHRVIIAICAAGWLNECVCLFNEIDIG